MVSLSASGMLDRGSSRTNTWTHTQVRGSMMATKRPAGVTSEVNLRNPSQSPPNHQRGFETQLDVQKSGPQIGTY